jgi:hypothetical protein
MHDRAAPALLAAILMEGRHWTNLRWEFGVKGFARSWQLSMVLLIVSTIALIRAGNLTSEDFLDLLSWLPFMMLPLGLAQQYSREGGVPTVTFSFIARRKMEADRRAGRPVEITPVHLAYPFFMLVLITAGMGVGALGVPEKSEWQYALGVLVLLGWALTKVVGKRERPVAWALAYGAAVLIGVTMLLGVAAAYFFFSKAGGGFDRKKTSAFETQATLGEVQRLQASPKILWRYGQEEGPPPPLLKLAAYNRPYKNYWKASLRKQELREQIPEERSVGGDFEKLLSEDNGDFRYRTEGRSADDYRRVGWLMGLISEEALVPHPAKTSRFEGVPSDVLSVNSLGAFQMTGVRQGAMEVRLFSDEREEPVELDPTEEDLIYLLSEAGGLRNFLEEIGLQPPPDRAEREGSPRRLTWSGETPRSVSPSEFREMKGRLALAFNDKENFRYSLVSDATAVHQPITRFLAEDNRVGHCEYFAGATAMLLRRMGVPTRYVVGFSVQEEDGEKEWVLRGYHAHAWAQAYVGGTWVDEGTEEEPLWRCRGGEWVEVDLTPVDWTTNGFATPWHQWLSDWFQSARTYLVVWISDPAIVSGVKMVIVALLVPGLLLLVYRLVTTRRREGGERGPWDELAAGGKAIRRLERWLGKRVGRRPAGVPMGTWLREHLPDPNGELIERYERSVYRDDGAEEELKTLAREARIRWREQRKNPGAGGPAGLGK